MKLTEPELELLASVVTQSLPAGIVKASQHLATIAEYAIRSHRAVDTGVLQQVRQELFSG